MNPKNFLMWAGWILLVLGVVGFLLPNGTLIPDYLWFDTVENWAHALLGVVALALVYGVKDHATHKWFAIIFGAVALIVGLWGFVLEPGTMESLNFLGVANLENPLDNIVHLVVGVWGLWAALGKKQT